MLLDVESGNMISSRREVFQLTGAGLASAAALSIAERAPAQVPEDADSPSVTIVRKGINKELDIVNIDLLQAAAKQVLPKGVFVFIANGNGEQWTLRENRRAFGDYALSPHRMSRIARDRIDTSITLLGKKLNLTEDFCSNCSVFNHVGNRNVAAAYSDDLSWFKMTRLSADGENTTETRGAVATAGGIGRDPQCVSVVQRGAHHLESTLFQFCEMKPREIYAECRSRGPGPRAIATPYLNRGVAGHMRRYLLRSGMLHAPSPDAWKITPRVSLAASQVRADGADKNLPVGATEIGCALHLCRRHRFELKQPDDGGHQRWRNGAPRIVGPDLPAVLDRRGLPPGPLRRRQQQKCLHCRANKPAHAPRVSVFLGTRAGRARHANWIVTKPDHHVEEGRSVALAGRGRIGELADGGRDPAPYSGAAVVADRRKFVGPPALSSSGLDTVALEHKQRGRQVSISRINVVNAARPPS